MRQLSKKTQKGAAVLTMFVSPFFFSVASSATRLALSYLLRGISMSTCPHSF